MDPKKKKKLNKTFNLNVPKIGPKKIYHKPESTFYVYFNKI